MEAPAYDLDLLVDPQVVAQEVDVAHAEAECLSLAKAAACRDDGDGPVASGEGIDALDDMTREAEELGSLRMTDAADGRLLGAVT